MSRIEINGNFHTLKKQGLSPFEMERYGEYREKWEKYPSKRMVDRFPIHLDVEVTASCNLKCPFCITTHADFEKGFMEYDLYTAIVDEGSDKGLYSIKLNWRGEPLLHKKLPDMIRYAKNKGIIDVFINTNATLLSKEMARNLIESGIDRVIISFEGYEKELYESQRVGAKFERTVENIKSLVDLKREMKRSFPWIRIQTIMIEELKGKIEQYSRFWEGIVDEVACIDIKNEVNRITAGKSEWACPQLWQRLTISWDGHILPCVNDHFCRMSFGKFPEISLEEAWKHQRLNRMREMHDKSKAHEIEGCLDCPLRSAQILKE
ncbi:MAG: radical SAM protein [Deltaproteobacteria bacterium]|nr:radical SAM protein [Deltaproteobacteria bacterium]